jgi:hypothetical protein
LDNQAEERDVRRDLTLLLAFAVAVILMFVAMPSRAEQLYLVGETKTIRYLIDVDSIEISEDVSRPFLHFTVMGVNLNNGTRNWGRATTRLDSCDNQGGDGAITFRGEGDRLVVWSAQGERVYDSMYRHACEWVVVILKEKPERLIRPKSRRGVPGA